MTVDEKQARAVDRMLKNLPKGIRNKILREELRKSAKSMVGPAKAATPLGETGRLRKSVKVRAMKRSRKSVGVVVGYGDKSFSGTTFYGSFLEWGWRIGKRPSRANKATDTRKKVEGRFMLTRVAEKLGPGVISRALTAIGYRITVEARNA
jgi:hypothetical protein